MSEHPYDELPGLLFGELNRAEVTVVSNHLADCDDCRRELAVLAATSASLRATARQAEAVGREAEAVGREAEAVGREEAAAGQTQPGAGQALAGVGQEQAVDSPERAAPGSATLPHRGTEPGTGSLEAAPGAGEVAPGAGRAGRRRRPLIGLAAALALAVVAAAVLLWTGPLRPDRPDSTVPLAGVGAVAASGQASMAGADGAQEMTVTTHDLPALRPGQYYEVWLLDPDAGAVFPVGVLPPDGEARFTLPASVVGRYQAIDVSLEADDGDPTHSKRSFLRGRYA
jgi:hypothetical protein